LILEKATLPTATPISLHRQACPGEGSCSTSVQIWQTWGHFTGLDWEVVETDLRGFRLEAFAVLDLYWKNAPVLRFFAITCFRSQSLAKRPLLL
jgi:hypothetical protein